MLQLDPPIPLRTPLGDGDAILVTDRGPGTHLEWTVRLHVSGEIWTFRNPYVRRQTSITEGWTGFTPFPADTYRDLFPWVCEQDREPCLM